MARKIENMRKWIIIIFAGMVFLNGCQVPTAAQRRAYNQRMAQACWEVVHSPLADKSNIDPADPELPQAIRALQPSHVEIGAGMVVVTFPLQNGITEYHLAPAGSSPGTWVLFAAGPKFGNNHQEILRFQTNDSSAAKSR